MRRFSTVALVAASGACAASPRPTPGVPGPSSNETTFDILHFNDVYEITPVSGGREGGLARVATIRKRLLASHPALLTTLGGDFFAPSALGTARVDGQPLAGKQMVAVLNSVGLDWATLGNHEFDVSPAAFRDRIAESRFRYVVSNVTDSAGQQFPGTVPHAVVPVKIGDRTIRLGLVGITTAANRVPWVRYADSIASARTHVAMIRDSADVIVALTHLNVRGDQRLAEEIPEIDLILGGHEHENYLLRRGDRMTSIVKADANVRSVAVVSLHFATAGARPRITSELVAVGDSTAEDPTVAAEVARWVSIAYSGYERDGFQPRAVVATIADALDGREATVRTRSGTLSDRILAGMRREAPQASVAIFNGGSIRIDDVVPPGPVTQYDVIRILPFGGRLVRAEVTGRLLDRVLRVGRSNAGTGGYLQVSGVEWAGEEPRLEGAALVPDQTYGVVISDFLLTGREANLGFLTRTNPELKVIEELRDIRLALIDELARSR